MPELERPTVTLHYEDTGTVATGNPALVFLHGWCDSAESWRETMAAFKAEYRCIAPDMRGCGQSGMPRDHAYGPEPLSNDVVELCRSLGVEKPILIGHSYGGYLAAEIARRFPGFPGAVVVEDQALELREFGTRMRQLESVIRSPESHMAFRMQMLDSLAGSGLGSADRALVYGTAEKTPVEVGQALWAGLFEFSPMELAEAQRQPHGRTRNPAGAQHRCGGDPRLLRDVALVRAERAHEGDCLGALHPPGEARRVSRRGARVPRTDLISAVDTRNVKILPCAGVFSWRGSASPLPYAP